MTVIRELIKNEGFSAFFKGLTPKVLYVYYLSISTPDAGDGNERRPIVVFPLSLRDLRLTVLHFYAL